MSTRQPQLWDADLCVCGHTRIEHKLRPRDPHPFINGRTRGECTFPLCPCSALDIDPVEFAHGEAILADQRRTGAREFAAEMGWKR